MTPCVVCERPLDHTPRLGEYIAHPICEKGIRRYFSEGYRIGRVEREILLNLVERAYELGELDGYWMLDAMKALDRSREPF